MAKILLDKFTAKEIKGHITALNAMKNLPAKAPTGGGKEKLAQGFVDAIVGCNDAGVLDSVPEEVFTFYQSIVAPEAEKEPTDGGQGGQGTDDAATTDTETGKAKPVQEKPEPKPKKKTRGQVFAELLPTLAPGKRAEWAEQYREAYDPESSKPESAFRVGVYADLLIAMGIITENNKKVLTYNG